MDDKTTSIRATIKEKKNTFKYKNKVGILQGKSHAFFENKNGCISLFKMYLDL